jgi:hypothetical protein
MDIVIAQVRCVIDVGDEVIAVQIVGQVDKVVDVTDLITASVHDGNELFLLSLVQLFQTASKIVELVKALILSQHIIHTMQRTLIVGDEPFLVYLTELVFAPIPIRSNTFCISSWVVGNFTHSPTSAPSLYLPRLVT